MARSMMMIFERPVSRLAQWARSVSGFSLVLFVTAGVGHRYGLVETKAFLWVLVLVAVLAMLGLVLAAGGFSRLWRFGERAGRASLMATLFSIVALTPFGISAALYLRLPALTDISTDLDRPPRFAVAPRLRDHGMNRIVAITAETAKLQTQAYPDITGRRLDASPDRVLAALAPAIAARGWTAHGTVPISADSPEISIEMEAPSMILRFPADAVVRLSDGEETTYVDMRMAARYGPHDLGANARRIRAFLEELEAELERQSLQIIDIPPTDGRAPEEPASPATLQGGT